MLKRNFSIAIAVAIALLATSSAFAQSKAPESKPETPAAAPVAPAPTAVAPAPAQPAEIAIPALGQALIREATATARAETAEAETARYKLQNLLQTLADALGVRPSEVEIRERRTEQGGTEFVFVRIPPRADPAEPAGAAPPPATMPAAPSAPPHE